MKTNFFSRTCTVCISAALSLVLWNAAANATPPSIDNQPRSQTIILFQQAAFGVIASGTAPLIYQWRKDGLPISSASNDQIVIAHAQFSDVGRYSVVVSNADGSVSSGEAVLTVNSPKVGDVDFSFTFGSSINGTVASVALQPDGKVLIGGGFSTVYGTARGGIARLNADGSTDCAFMNGLAGANGFANSVVLQNDGKVLIGGEFTTVNGVTRNHIARLNADGALDRGFQERLSGVSGSVNPNIYTSKISAVEVQNDGKVLITGIFTTVNGVARTNIARLNADGTVDNGFQNGLSGLGSTSGRPAIGLSIAVQSDGKALIGGGFTTVNGEARNCIARVNADGTLDGAFQSRLPSVTDVFYVNSVVVQSDGKILLGGLFASVDNAVSRYNIARLNRDGTVDKDFQSAFSDAGDYVSSVLVQSDGKILVGGTHSFRFDFPRGFLAQLSMDGALIHEFHAQGWFNAVAVQGDGKVLIGGSFSYDVPVGGILRLWGSADVPPHIQSVSRIGGVALTWDALPNRMYRLQYKDSISTNTWTDLAGDVSGSVTGTARKTDTTESNATQRFYRVLLLP
jgi:uncharacterized delta-60 repeat protein